MSNGIYDFEVDTIMMLQKSLADFEGKVVLIVNTASKCGFTPQFKDLQALYESYRDRGFEILGFPCNQFMKQDPGTNEEIRNFCSVNYGVTFPMFAKIDVNGSDEHPLYKFLKNALPGAMGTKAIKWNFTKFLVDKNGVPYKRYGSSTVPDDLRPDIEKLLDS